MKLSELEVPKGDFAKEEASAGRMCYSSDDLRRFLIQTKRSWARRYPDLGSLADGHNLNRLVGSEAWGLGLTYNNRSCSRVQWLDSTWKLGQLRQGWGMGRRQVSSQQNVSYSTSTRRETWSHVTADKLTVAYAAQTVSNFGANREFRTSICLGDTTGKLAGTMERISSRWIHPGTRPSSLANTFCDYIGMRKILEVALRTSNLPILLILSDLLFQLHSRALLVSPLFLISCENQLKLIPILKKTQ